MKTLEENQFYSEEERLDDHVKAYFTEISQYPLLSKIEEIIYGRIIQDDNGNYTEEERLEAIEKLVTSNLRFVVSIAKKYHNISHLSFMDIVQEGNDGLIEATRKYDPETGFRFLTYAAWWIRQRLTKSIADSEKIIRKPVYMTYKLRNYQKAINEFKSNFGREPTEDEAKDAFRNKTGLSENIADMVADVYVMGEVISLNDLAGEGNTELINLLEDINVKGPDVLAERASLRNYLFRLMEEELDERETDILKKITGLNREYAMTLEDTGRTYDITKERTRQIKNKALLKLRTAMTK
ncbi:MAG: RNA polymerase sigma factor RpoD/SigA [Nanoarchaeota archaeon]